MIHLFSGAHCVPVYYASIYYVEVGAVVLEIVQARRVRVVVLAIARVDPQVVYGYNALARFVPLGNDCGLGKGLIIS